jgi:hypothetical protein
MEGSGRGLISGRLLYRNFPGGTENNHEKSRNPVMFVGLQAEI